MSVNGVGNLSAGSILQQKHNQPANPASGFGELLGKQIAQVNEKQLQAEQAVMDFATGKEQNVHRVIIAETEAELSFKMLAQVRNQLVDAYKEIMRMQI